MFRDCGPVQEGNRFVARARASLTLSSGCFASVWCELTLLSLTLFDVRFGKVQFCVPNLVPCTWPWVGAYKELASCTWQSGSTPGS